MEKKTIGQFIAILRKANGLTQQDVADRLNVSNKAVSRWERDESAPDITLIPAIAEMFDVTCDELLKGERIINTDSSERKNPKIEKQIESITKHTLTSTNIMLLISFSLSLAGGICMYSFSYLFNKSYIGFVIMLLLEITAFTFTTVAIIKLKELQKNELLENTNNTLIKSINNSLGKYSFLSYIFILLTTLLGQIVLLSVYDFITYFIVSFPIILFVLMVYLYIKEPFYILLTNYRKLAKSYIVTLIMTALQISTLIIADILFYVAPFFEKYDKASFINMSLFISGIIFICLNVVLFIYFIIKFKKYLYSIIISGIRNILLIIPCIIASFYHSCSFEKDDSLLFTEKILINHHYNDEHIINAIIIALITAIIFKLISNAYNLLNNRKPV